MNIGKKYYACQTWCQDGDHEYSDIFLIVMGKPKYDEDEVDKAILSWNYGDCEWDDNNNSYSDGGWRSISVRQFDEIDKIEHDALAKQLNSFLFSQIWKGYQENEKWKNENKKERITA